MGSHIIEWKKIFRKKGNGNRGQWKRKLDGQVGKDDFYRVR